MYIHTRIDLNSNVSTPPSNSNVSGASYPSLTHSGKDAAFFVKHKPLSVLHIVWVAWSLLVNVTTGPLLELPMRIYHSWVVCRMGALEILVPIGRRGHTTTLGRMLLHPHV